MFQSEPICILTAGPTIDGRHVEQQVIDDIAELYNPKTYNARINEEHWSWSDKCGSVLSVEKRGNELWAVLKPNSKLLTTIERDQLLHTSCEIEPNYLNTGKSYLTGLALTDSPASLGTTAMHLSARKPADKGKIMLCTGATIDKKMMLAEDADTEELDQNQAKTLLSRLVSFLSERQEFSEQDDKEELSVDKEVKALLAKNAEQNETISTVLNTLTAAVEKLSSQRNEVAIELTKLEESEINTDVDEALTAKVELLTAEVSELKVLLSQQTDEGGRTLAGGVADDDYL
ncbi:GPO family capsid scaffolding protein [Shewanella sp. D64]|uniref:GPO family capsid scaffolding protein n=1 Tax=unclassified Shewanella TaxID=196818 RepID=UPI0022BA25AC|nr:MULTISPECIES: GPO family capsid scaffolding protein [unclassified Shewanella]MEC4729005.1 GPO family capsid scaffolding protein [Shewanella sp. D64]MEC4740031.1 GPO family capsid scaffolding protein [Shewanella sp. E94]WBJ94387.1 GPO family capsid scaffolding protein [Shewanella sp. MTB7]